MQPLSARNGLAAGDHLVAHCFRFRQGGEAQQQQDLTSTIVLLRRGIQFAHPTIPLALYLGIVVIGNFSVWFKSGLLNLSLFSSLCRPPISPAGQRWLNAEAMAAQAALIADTIMGMKRALRKEQDCKCDLFF